MTTEKETAPKKTPLNKNQKNQPHRPHSGFSAVCLNIVARINFMPKLEGLWRGEDRRNNFWTLEERVGSPRTVLPSGGRYPHPRKMGSLTQMLMGGAFCRLARNRSPPQEAQVTICMYVITTGSTQTRRERPFAHGCHDTHCEYQQKPFSLWQALWSPSEISRDTMMQREEGSGCKGCQKRDRRRNHFPDPELMDIVLLPLALMPGNLGAITRVRIIYALSNTLRLFSLPFYQPFPPRRTLVPPPLSSPHVPLSILSRLPSTPPVNTCHACPSLLLYSRSTRLLVYDTCVTFAPSLPPLFSMSLL